MNFQPMPELEQEQWDGLVADILANGVRHVWGLFFDSVRPTDCSAIFKQCTVCTDADREWRDSHPDRVYRWRVSNLDIETAVDA